MQIFGKYYKELFTSISPPQDRIEKFLWTITLPKVSEEHQNILNASLMEIKIRRAVSYLKPIKELGPDGFTSEFYKKFCDVFVKRLKMVFYNCIRENIIPSTWKVLIVLIPKPDKDLQDP